MNAKHLLSALTLALAAVGAHAQYQVASSVSGATVAAAPLADIRGLIAIAQGTANTANNTATSALAVGYGAQATATWAGDVANVANNAANNAQGTANNALNTANAISGRVDATWQLGLADCSMALPPQLGGNVALATQVCQANNPRPW